MGNPLQRVPGVARSQPRVTATTGVDASVVRVLDDVLDRRGFRTRVERVNVNAPDTPREFPAVAV